MDIKVSDILKVCGGKLICGDTDMVFTNFSKDTRTINKDDVYVGIKGESIDGSKFYLDAFEKGAKGVIINKGFYKEN